jgi:DNA-3-methyladenine glycosylase II
MLHTLFAAEWADARDHWRRSDARLHAATPAEPVARPIDPEATHFGTLATAITHQQLSTSSGRAIARRVVAVCGGRWDAGALLRLSDETMRAAGLSTAKVRYLRGLAAAESQGALKGFEALDDEEVVARLTKLDGVGVWTAKMFLLFHLHRPDVFAGDDFGLRAGIRLLDELSANPSPRAAEARAAVWQPYRSVASLVLWDLVRRSRLANSSPDRRPRRASGQ